MAHVVTPNNNAGFSKASLYPYMVLNLYGIEFVRRLIPRENAASVT